MNLKNYTKEELIRLSDILIERVERIEDGVYCTLTDKQLVKIYNLYAKDSRLNCIMDVEECGKYILSLDPFQAFKLGAQGDIDLFGDKFFRFDDRGRLQGCEPRECLSQREQDAVLHYFFYSDRAKEIRKSTPALDDLAKEYINASSEIQDLSCELSSR